MLHLLHRWGCVYEQDAVKAYKHHAELHHQGFRIEYAGLFLHLDDPYIGASPDRIVCCDCHGKGVLEVKCPFCMKDGLPDNDKENIFMVLKDGKWTLKHDHTYLYQVQTQLNVCQMPYADFVVWTKNGMTFERIPRETQFLEIYSETIKHFFTYGILPEIVGKWYTRQPIADDDGIIDCVTNTKPVGSSGGDDDEDYEKDCCYCVQPSFGWMILCDNVACPIQWFHCECLRIRGKPKGKWYCPGCAKMKTRKKSKEE